MNKQITPGLIYAVANDKVGVESKSDALFALTGANLTKLDTVMEFGAAHADYHVIDTEFEKENRGNGTGYYDPVADAMFVDADGKALPVNSSVYIHDTKTNRRLYVIVLMYGNNLVIHDRYSMESRTVFVMTSQCSANDLIGMNPAWNDGCLYDLIGLSRLLGFEFDRTTNTVYAPRWKKNNWFKANNYQHVDHRISRLKSIGVIKGDGSKPIEPLSV